MAHKPFQASIRTLQDAARANLLLWFFCTYCGHRGRFSPYAMAQLARQNFALDDLRRHLRCSRCKMLGHAKIFPAEHSLHDERH